mgnify:CR=1 FL=1
MSIDLLRLLPVPSRSDVAHCPCCALWPRLAEAKQDPTLDREWLFHLSRLMPGATEQERFQALYLGIPRSRKRENEQE